MSCFLRGWKSHDPGPIVQSASHEAVESLLGGMDKSSADGALGRTGLRDSGFKGRIRMGVLTAG